MPFWRRDTSTAGEKTIKRVRELVRTLKLNAKPSQRRSVLREIASLVRGLDFTDRETLMRELNMEHLNPQIAYFRRQADEALQRLHALLTGIREKRKRGVAVPPEEVGLAKQLEQTYRERFLLAKAAEMQQLELDRVIKLGSDPAEVVAEGIAFMQQAQMEYHRVEEALSAYDDITAAWGTADELLARHGLTTSSTDTLTEESQTGKKRTAMETEEERLIRDYLGEEES